MAMWAQRRRDEWSPWRWRFAVLPSIAGLNESDQKVWVWWDWYEKRSMNGYAEYRKPGVPQTARMDDWSF